MTNELQEQLKTVETWFTGRVNPKGTDYMGRLRGSDPRYYNWYDTVLISSLKYHSSFDRLAPVAKKVLAEVQEIDAQQPTLELLGHYTAIKEAAGNLDIKILFKATYEAIMFLNSTK